MRDVAHNQRRDLESETEEFEWIRRQHDEGCDHDSRTLTGGRSQLPVSPSCRAGAYIPNWRLSRCVRTHAIRLPMLVWPQAESRLGIATRMLFPVSKN